MWDVLGAEGGLQPDWLSALKATLAVLRSPAGDLELPVLGAPRWRVPLRLLTGFLLLMLGAGPGGLAACGDGQAPDVGVTLEVVGPSHLPSFRFSLRGVTSDGAVTDFGSGSSRVRVDARTWAAIDRVLVCPPSGELHEGESVALPRGFPRPSSNELGLVRLEVSASVVRRVRLRNGSGSPLSIGHLRLNGPCDSPPVEAGGLRSRSDASCILRPQSGVEGEILMPIPPSKDWSCWFVPRGLHADSTFSFPLDIRLDGPQVIGEFGFESVLAGVTVFGDGTPCPGATVVVSGSGDPQYAEVLAVSDANGRFAVAVDVSERMLAWAIPTDRICIDGPLARPNTGARPVWRDETSIVLEVETAPGLYLDASDSGLSLAGELSGLARDRRTGRMATLRPRWERGRVRLGMAYPTELEGIVVDRSTGAYVTFKVLGDGTSVLTHSGRGILRDLEVTGVRSEDRCTASWRLAGFRLEVPIRPGRSTLGPLPESPVDVAFRVERADDGSSDGTTTRVDPVPGLLHVRIAR